MLVMRTSMITVARFPKMPCQGYFLGASNPGSVVVDHIKSVSNSCPILTSFSCKRAVRFGATASRPALLLPPSVEGAIVLGDGFGRWSGRGHRRHLAVLQAQAAQVWAHNAGQKLRGGFALVGIRRANRR
jgi:hypothetical protein